MRLLENKLEGAHGILKFVAFECFALYLVDPGEDLVETVLKVLNALSIHLFDFRALVRQLLVIFTS